MKTGDVVRFRHDPNEPLPATYDTQAHTGIVMDAWDELGDDQNIQFADVLWSTAGSVGSVARHNPRHLEIVSTKKEA